MMMMMMMMMKPITLMYPSLCGMAQSINLVTTITTVQFMFGMEPHIQTLYDDDDDDDGDGDDDDDATNYGYDAYDEYGTDYDHSYMVI